MEWSNDLILQLIELYGERPCLWDPTNNNYKVSSKKSDAWKEVAKSLNCDAVIVKKKMESLLSSFRRERQRQITRSGAGTEDCYKSTWFAFKSMSFLMDKYTTRNTQNTVDGEDINTSLDDSVNDNENSNTNDDGHITIVVDKEVITVPPTSEENPRRKDFTSPKKILSRKRKVVDDPRVEAAYKILQETVSSRAPRDQSAIFGEHIAMKHRKYSNYTRSVVEHLISNILFEADMGKYNDPSSNQLHLPLSSTPNQSPSPSPSSHSCHSQQSTGHSASFQSHDVSPILQSASPGQEI